MNKPLYSDKLLGRKCSNECYLLLDICLLSCEYGKTDSITDCLTKCDYDHESCVMSCPCHSDCKQGCSNCKSKYCTCSTDEAIEDKQTCLDQNEKVYMSCLYGCNHDSVCMADCGRSYDENIRDCPCNEGCPQGCPCPNFDCLNHNS